MLGLGINDGPATTKIGIKKENDQTPYLDLSIDDEDDNLGDLK